MAQIRWTPQGFNDLESIAHFIAKDSPHYARLFVIDIFRTIDRLVDFPKSGRIIPELKDPRIREIIFGNYRVVYRLKEKIAEILTVYHGAKLLDPSRIK
jgi:plasmid stabilization system protein ParE